MHETYVSKYTGNWNLDIDSYDDLLTDLYKNHCSKKDEIISWLEETFGKNYTEVFNTKIAKINQRWYIKHKSGIRYYFRNNEDAILFKLTWM